MTATCILKLFRQDHVPQIDSSWKTAASKIYRGFYSVIRCSNVPMKLCPLLKRTLLTRLVGIHGHSRKYCTFTLQWKWLLVVYTKAAVRPFQLLREERQKDFSERILVIPVPDVLRIFYSSFVHIVKPVNCKTYPSPPPLPHVPTCLLVVLWHL